LAVEVAVIAMELDLVEDKADVATDEDTVACGAQSISARKRRKERRTSLAFATNRPRTSFQPTSLLLRLLKDLCGRLRVASTGGVSCTHDRMAFLQDLVNGDEGLVSLHLVGQDR
jgi:hypothetical protein